MNTATTQLNRIVTLVAELSRRAGHDETPPTIDEVAARHGTTPRQIQADVRTLTGLTDSAAAEWLLSLTAYHEGDRLYLRSGGPFRRPIRLLPDELLALQIGVAAAAGEGALSDALIRLLRLGVDAEPSTAFPSTDTGTVAEAIRVATADRRKLDLRYAGESAESVSARTVHPYQLVEARGRRYLIGWCETVGDWRRFRVDRILDATPVDEPFDEVADVPLEVFRVAGEVDEVEVRFSSTVARWIRERHGEVRDLEDGAVVVRYRVASPEWFVREILQYGTEAEVVGPASYRELVRRAVA